MFDVGLANNECQNDLNVKLMTDTGISNIKIK